MSKPNQPKEFLVALLKARADFAILRDEGWYRIPVNRAPKRWPPRWLGFYQPKAFGAEAYRVQWYGEVAAIDEVMRQTLFPHEPSNPKSQQPYFRIRLRQLEQRAEPVLSHRPRRLLFIPTTWEKFEHAEELNDLFDDSPLEDALWAGLKQLQLSAERQWLLETGRHHYALDFAVFCHKGFVNIEADGDTWHTQKGRIASDNTRNNALAARGWQVLRFNGHQIREQLASYCLPEVRATINTLGGLSSDGLVPRVFHDEVGQFAEQLSLLEPRAPYSANFDDGSAYNLEL